MRFTQEVKDQWVTALRSGDYKQGMRRLYSPSTNRYCCLGVLGELNGLLDGYGKPVDGKEGTLSYKFLPERIQKDLINLNDLSGRSFCEIANYIEANVIAEDSM